VEDTEDKDKDASSAADAEDENGKKRKRDVPLPRPLADKLPGPKPLETAGVKDPASVPEHERFEPSFRQLTMEEKLLFGATYEAKNPDKKDKPKA